MSKEFSRWVHQFQDDAWSLARYLLQDASEAEDAVQDAFVKLWHNRGDIETDSIRPWLMKVTRNNCIDRIRRRRPMTELVEHIDEVNANPNESAEQVELKRWLMSAISELKEPNRSLIILRDLMHHSYEEVALTTGLSLSQVKVYLHRTRKELRETLSEIR